jgi:hypothetical protein
MEDYSTKIARLFNGKFNLKKGDCVALMMESQVLFLTYRKLNFILS